MNVDLIDGLLFIAFVLDFLLALFIITKSSRKESDFTFALSTLAVGLWTLGIFMFRLSQTLSAALFWNREFIFTSGLIASTFLHFSLALTKAKLSNFKRFLLHLPNLLILIAVFIPGWLIRDIVMRPWGKESLLGLCYPLFAIYFSGYITYALIRIFLVSRKKTGAEKKQLNYIFAATLLTSIVGTYFNLYLILLGNYRYIWVGPYNSLVLVTVITFAITKLELMEIKIAITRTAAYGIVGLLLTGSFVALNSLQMPISLTMTTNAALALLWAWAAHRLREIIQTPLEEKWITGWYDTNKLLNRITQRLIPVMSKEDVFSIIAEELKSTIKISRIDVETDKLESGYADVAKNKNTVVIPLSSSSGPEGKIILGPKTSEDAYNDRDLTLFRSIRLQAVAIFDRIRPFETIKKEFDANQKKLYETEKELERSARLASLGTLTAGVAHEIRNPMSVLRSKAQKLENKLEDKAFLKEYAALSIKHIDRILNIIKGMLDQSKSHEAETKPININSLIEESLAYFAITKINVVKNFSDCPEIQGDPIRLSQVFINLIQNAIRAMPDGGTLSLNTTLENGDIKVTVADTGKGISAENLEKIFNPFFTTWNEGVGLGLSTTHRIIADYKGRIEVKSQEEKGTTFTVYLPVKR